VSGCAFLFLSLTESESVFVSVNVFFRRMWIVVNAVSSLVCQTLYLSFALVADVRPVINIV